LQHSLRRGTYRNGNRGGGPNNKNFSGFSALARGCDI
jgi:hypothetical protein